MSISTCESHLSSEGVLVVSALLLAVAVVTVLPPEGLVEMAEEEGVNWCGGAPGPDGDLCSGNNRKGQCSNIHTHDSGHYNAWRVWQVDMQMCK